MSINAKLFMSGRSQALRLPARFRMDASEVRIEPMGGGLYIEPIRETAEPLDVWLSRFYDSTPKLPEDFLSDRQDALPQERDWTSGEGL